MNAQNGPFVWTQSLSNNARVYAINVHPTNQNILYAATLDSGVFKTTNRGTSWFSVNTGLPYRAVQSLAISRSNPNVLYAGTDQNGGANSGVYITTDGGGSWTLINNGITDNKGIQSIVVDPTDPTVAFAGVFDGVVNSTNGLYKTTDAGTTWVPSINGIGTIKNFLCLAINPLNGNTVYAGTSFNTSTSRGPSRMYKSTNGGDSWLDIGSGLPKDTLSIDPIRALSISTADTSVILAAVFVNDTAGGAFLSTNGGGMWIKKHTGLPTLTGTLLRSCLIRPGSVTEFFIGLDGGGATSRGVWRTTNGGDTWADFNGGSLVNTYTVRGLAFRTQFDSTLYAGAATTTPPGQGVFEYTWSLTGVGGTPGGEQGSSFSLLQNYPNPFNPSTQIEFDLPEAGRVSLVVYDILGRQIAELVRGYREAGTHSATWTAADEASGVYFARFTVTDLAGNVKYSKVNKLVLMR